MALRKLSCSFPGATRQPALHMSLRRRGSCTVDWIPAPCLHPFIHQSPCFRPFLGKPFLFVLAHRGHGKMANHPCMQSLAPLAFYLSRSFALVLPYLRGELIPIRGFGFITDAVGGCDLVAARAMDAPPRATSHISLYDNPSRWDLCVSVTPTTICGAVKM